MSANLLVARMIDFGSYPLVFRYSGAAYLVQSRPLGSAVPCQQIKLPALQWDPPLSWDSVDGAVLCRV